MRRIVPCGAASVRSVGRSVSCWKLCHSKHVLGARTDAASSPLALSLLRLSSSPLLPRRVSLSCSLLSPYLSNNAPLCSATLEPCIFLHAMDFPKAFRCFASTPRRLALFPRHPPAIRRSSERIVRKMSSETLKAVSRLPGTFLVRSSRERNERKTARTDRPASCASTYDAVIPLTIGRSDRGVPRIALRKLPGDSIRLVTEETSKRLKLVAR